MNLLLRYNGIKIIDRTDVPKDILQYENKQRPLLDKLCNDDTKYINVFNDLKHV